MKLAITGLILPFLVLLVQRDAMIQPDTWKTFGDWAGKVWTALGPLVGVLIGSWLTKHHLKESRLADSKKEEYRELLSTLTRTLKTIANFHVPMSAHSGEEERAYDEAQNEAIIAIDTRLFIRKEINKMDLRQRWQNAVQELEQGGHSLAFVRTVRKITEDIKDSAENDLVSPLSRSDVKLESKSGLEPET